MSHTHQTHLHSYDANASMKARLIIAIIINLFITGSEVVAGIFASSYALITDAFHNFSDVLALVLSLIGIYLLSLKNSSDKTFGYRRVELMVGLINGLLLILIGIIIIKGAISLLISPNTVVGIPIIIFSALSIVLNGGCVLILEHGNPTGHSQGHSVSIKSSILHLFSDMLTSVAVCVGGIAILLWEVYWIDPIISIIIGLYVIWTSMGIVKYSMSLLLNFTPKNIDIHELCNAVQKIGGVDNMHHLHLWQLSEQEIHLEAHISTKQDYHLSQINHIQKNIEDLLQNSFNITHTTLQFEFDSDCTAHLIYEGEKTSHNTE